MALADILKKIFGSKSDRDMKLIRPTLEKILAVYPEWANKLRRDAGSNNISRSSEHIRTMSEQMNDRYKDADSEEMVKHS